MQELGIQFTIRSNPMLGDAMIQVLDAPREPDVWEILDLRQQDLARRVRELEQREYARSWRGRWARLVAWARKMVGR